MSNDVMTGVEINTVPCGTIQNSINRFLTPNSSTVGLTEPFFPVRNYISEKSIHEIWNGLWGLSQLLYS